MLDLGNIVVGSLISELLRLENRVGGPADDLRGLFDLRAADDFGYFGWDPFGGLGRRPVGAWPGHPLHGRQDWGSCSDLIGFDGFGYNASDPTGLAQQRSLLIRANVVARPKCPSRTRRRWSASPAWRCGWRAAGDRRAPERPQNGRPT